MDEAAGLREALYALEESLWRPKTRFDREYMEGVTDPCAFEFGRSGRTYEREAILAAAPVPFDVVLPLQDFAIHPIGPDAVLATYVSTATYDDVQVSNRSTIWVRADDGWRWVFHQGTPREPAR